MKYHDLRDFMSQLEKTGELKRINELKAEIYELRKRLDQ